VNTGRKASAAVRMVVLKLIGTMVCSQSIPQRISAMLVLALRVVKSGQFQQIEIHSKY
jgi:hypothetical protein